MILQNILIEGYRCFKQKAEIPVHDLTILIGENDCGKSSILRAIELLLTREEASPDDFFKIDADGVESFTIEGVFKQRDSKLNEELKPYIIDGYLTLRKIFTKEKAFITLVQKNELKDPDLANFEDYNVEQLKTLLDKLSLPAQSNQDKRKETVRAYIAERSNELPRARNFVNTPNQLLLAHLPIYQGYASNDYGNPQALIRKTLDLIYRSHFYDETGVLKISQLQALQKTIRLNLNKQMTENLLVHVKKYNPKVKKIRGRFDIDFASGLDFQGIELNEGIGGFKLLEQKGEGSKKRLFLSILEWDKEVQLDQENSRSIIRGYDEPDANLHYEAQRRVFYSIKDVTQSKDAHTQALIATHSIPMIDRAPAKSIVHILYNNGESSVNYLQSDGDIDIKKFLEQVSEIWGINNSSIFYEKAFLLVEGDSEDIALRKIYKRLFGRTLAEDGIVLINLDSNGAWFNFLKLLTKNKKSCTFLLLDADTQNDDCGARITLQRLREIGFDASFLKDNIIFAGAQEFEDMFPDNRILDTLNDIHSRDDAKKWSTQDVKTLRTKFKKITHGLKEITAPYVRYNKNWYRKPDFVSTMIDKLSDKDLTKLTQINDLFKKVRDAAGV